MTCSDIGCPFRIISLGLISVASMMMYSMYFEVVERIPVSWVDCVVASLCCVSSWLIYAGNRDGNVELCLYHDLSGKIGPSQRTLITRRSWWRLYGMIFVNFNTVECFLKKIFGSWIWTSCNKGVICWSAKDQNCIQILALP